MPNRYNQVEPRRILVVDDEQNITWLLKESLEAIPNCEVVTATDPRLALQLFMAQPYDMLITDYRMPQIDGLTLAKHIFRLKPQTVIVMLTAYEDQALREFTAAIFIQYILNKPIKIPEIRSVIRKALQQIEPSDKMLPKK